MAQGTRGCPKGGGLTLRLVPYALRLMFIIF